MSEEDRKQLVMTYKRCFATEDGKRVLADLKRLTTFATPAILPSRGVDTNKLIYDEAQRCVVLAIVAMVEADLDATPQTSAITEENPQ